MKRLLICMFLLACCLVGYGQRVDYGWSADSLVTHWVRVSEYDPDPPGWRRFPHAYAIRHICRGGWIVGDKTPEYIVYYGGRAPIYHEMLMEAYRYFVEHPKAVEYKRKEYNVTVRLKE